MAKKNLKIVATLLFVLTAGFGFAKHTHADAYDDYENTYITVNSNREVYVHTNTDSYTGCSATYTFELIVNAPPGYPASPLDPGYPTDSHDFVPGGTISMYVTRAEYNPAPQCNNHGAPTYDNGYIYYGFKGESDPTYPYYTSSWGGWHTFPIPAKPNTSSGYKLYLYGDVGYGSGSNFHRTSGTNWTVYSTPPTKVSVNDSSCPGGSYTIYDPSGYGYSNPANPLYVDYQSQGGNYVIAYTQPAGYTLDSILPASSQYIEVGQPGKTFTVNCSAIVITPPPTVTVDASPSSLSCPANSTISWSSTDATSCTTDWDGNPTVATADSKTVAVGASGGTYTVTCTGPGGTRSNSASVSVSAPSCAVPSNIQVVEYNQSTGLQISGGSWTVNPGGHTNTVGETFQVTPAVGGTVYTLTASNLSGYNPSPTVVADGVTGNSFTLLPDGSTKTFAIYYTPTPPPFVYNLSNGGSAYATVGLDSFAQTSITKTKTSGTTQSVTLSVSGAPAGTNPFFDGNGDCSPTCSTNLTFNVAPGMTPGTYPITVTGSPNNMTTTFNLVLNPPPNLTVTCGVTSSGTAKIGIPVTWSATVSGGTGNYTYSWSGTDIQSPGPTTNPFSITYGTVGQKSAQASVVDTVSGQTGTCAAGTVQVNFNPNYKEF